MTQQEIENKFKEVVIRKDFIKITGYSRQVVYNYRRRKDPSLGTMLEVLYKMGEIKIISSPLERG